MADMVLRRVATAPVAGRSILTPPPDVHAPSHSRTDRALALHSREMENMLSELRNRQRSAPHLSTATDHESATESEQTLTPGSSDVEQENQGTRVLDSSAGRIAWVTIETAPSTQAPALGAWHRLVGRLLTHSRVRATGESIAETENDNNNSRVKYKKLEEHAPGIPRLAAFLNSNESYCIFRKFGNEASRLLLIKEVELCQLATELDELNKRDAEDDSLRYRLTTVEHYKSWDPAQQELLDKIEAKLFIYYDLLLKYTDVRALREVPARYHQSVDNWVFDNGPLDKGEDAFLVNRDDFVKAQRSFETKNQGSVIEDEVEKYLTKHPNSFLNGLLRGRQEKQKANDTKVVHLSTFRFGVISKLSASILAIGFILAPVFILFLANLGRVKMAGVVGAFVLIFLVGVVLVVDLTTQDIFIITVAYSAVLVTLLSNFLQANASGGGLQ